MSTQKSIGTKAIAIAIIALLVGVAIGYGVASLAPATTAGPAGARLTGEIPIGVMEALTGAWGVIGSQESQASQLAIEDVNAWLKATGQQFTLKALVEDSASDPAIALEKIQSLHARGVNIVIGPSLTGVVKNIAGYVNDNKILVIAASSTGASMAVPDDYIFRPAPTDVYQVKAGARLIATYGIKAVVFLRHNTGVVDEYVGLYQKDYVEGMGGKIAGDIKFDPGTTDFSTQMRALNDAVTKAINDYGKDNVAVEFCASSEITAALQAAKDYPALMSVNWFGNDGIVDDPRVVQEAADVAQKVVLASTVFAATESPKYQAVVEKIQSKVGAFPSVYAVANYDEVWVLAYAMVATQSADATVLKTWFPKVAEDYFGATGWFALNNDGDRAFGDFAIRGVKDGKWYPIATWSASTDSIVWRVSTPPRATG